jgi:general secretion pathway protein H
MISPSKGFTFLEILVVLLLISLAASLVATNVSKSTGEKRTVFFARQVHSMCVKARNQAMINGSPRAFIISASERTCWIVPENKLEIPSHITIEGEYVETADNNTYVIRFYPDGSATGGILFFKVDDVTVFRVKVNSLTGIIDFIQEGSL